MGIAELNAIKVDLVRYILDEADADAIKHIMFLIQDKKKKTLSPKELSSHLGKLKRGIDGLEYQKTIRNEWD